MSHYVEHNFICGTTIIAQYPYLAGIKQELSIIWLQFPEADKP
jgi:hypothetical protein